MKRRTLPELYACPACNGVPIGGEGCGCPNDLQVRENARGQPTAYSSRRYPPVAVREARDVVVHTYDGPLVLPKAEPV